MEGRPSRPHAPNAGGPRRHRDPPAAARHLRRAPRRGAVPLGLRAHRRPGVQRRRGGARRRGGLPRPRAAPLPPLRPGHRRHCQPPPGGRDGAGGQRHRPLRAAGAGHDGHSAGPAQAGAPALPHRRVHLVGPGRVAAGGRPARCHRPRARASRVPPRPLPLLRAVPAGGHGGRRHHQGALAVGPAGGSGGGGGGCDGGGGTGAVAAGGEGGHRRVRGGGGGRQSVDGPRSVGVGGVVLERGGGCAAGGGRGAGDQADGPGGGGGGVGAGARRRGAG
mmetsp:Transcript_74734/g.200256  ORF Transcript_74734/g.200256 Transcript_74734/m.200256 type:complete len:277 (+) Transcript_74734:1063-1893(+)